MTIHPRRKIREAIAARIASVIRVVDDAVYPENYDYTKVEGDDGFVAYQPRNVHWTPAIDRVFSTRSVELMPEDLPCIIVQTANETVVPVSKSGWDGGYRRTLTVTIEGLAEALDDVEDNLDAIAIGVEGSLDGLLMAEIESGHLLLERCETDIEREGEIPIGAIRLTYECVYTTYHLGVDLGLWDPDGACIVNFGPNPPIQQITVSTNFGDEIFTNPWEDLSNG